MSRLVASAPLVLALVVLAPAPAEAAAAAGRTCAAKPGERKLAESAGYGPIKSARFLLASRTRIVRCSDGRRRVLARTTPGSRVVIGTIDFGHAAVAEVVGHCRRLRVRSWRASDGRPAIDARIRPGACRVGDLHAARSGSVAIARDGEILFAERPGVRLISRAGRDTRGLGSGPSPLVTWDGGLAGAVIDRRRCTVPPGRREVTADDKVVVHTMTASTGDDLFEDGSYGGLLVCRRDEGITRLLARIRSDFSGGESAEMIRLRHPWVAWVGGNWTRTTGGSTSIQVADLRTMSVVTGVGAGSDGADVRRLLLTAAGTVVYAVDDSRATMGWDPSIDIRVARGKDVAVLDEGPGVDLDSVTLTGRTVSWLSGGQPRSAEIP